MHVDEKQMTAVVATIHLTALVRLAKKLFYGFTVVCVKEHVLFARGTVDVTLSTEPSTSMHTRHIMTVVISTLFYLVRVTFLP